jgi:uncharacterized membrane protein
MIKKRVRRGVKIALLVPVGLAAAAVFGLIVMYLWNWLAPAVFAARTITFWQALGLLILARILVGGLGGGHGADKHGRRSMMDRWERMTPEEREAFRQGLRNCGEVREPANTPPAAPSAAPSA